MSEPQPACNDDSLIALLSDDFSHQESESTLDHLESCTQCQQRLSDLVASRDEWQRAAKLISTCYEHAGSGQPVSSLSLEQYPVVWTESMAARLLSPASHPEMLGRLGRYEIEGLIGSGGMGVVFKAFDRELNRPVAIKVLAPFLASSGLARKRFSREARAAAAVVHPHVVPIHNVETERESPFIVMQFVSGESLQERIDREGSLELCEVLRIGMQVADGLSAAHDQGLVHRDIKPSNTLLEEDVDRALISDFGLARAADDASLTRTGIHAGTPQYMSPEQASGESIDARSDLFSLGSMLYTMCTGQPPFRAESSLGVMRKISDESPIPIRELNPEIPEWLCSTINKLMAKEKSERFQSAHEVKEVLESCLGHVQHPAMHPLPATLTPNSKQQISPQTLLGVFAMLTLTTAVCLFWIPGNNVPPANAPVVKQPTQNNTAVKNQDDRDDNQSQAQAEGKTPIQQISQLLGKWKKSSTDRKQAQAYAEKLRVLAEELYGPLKPNTESHRQASQELAVICWPYVLDAMPKTMAQAIIGLTKPDAAVRVSDRLADQGRPTEPLGWDIQATHALALARAGAIEQALQENDALMNKIQINLMRGRLPDLEMEFLGANRTEKSLLKQTFLQRALILGLADRIAESTDASTSAGAVDVNKPTKADLLAIQTLIQKTIEAQTPARPDFSAGIKEATSVRKTNNVHGETFYLRTEVDQESFVANVRKHLGSHWRRRKLKEQDMLQAAVKGRQLPATVALSVYENMNSPGMEVHLFFLTYKTKSREPNVHINVVPASRR